VLLNARRRLASNLSDAGEAEKEVNLTQIFATNGLNLNSEIRRCEMLQDVARIRLEEKRGISEMIRRASTKAFAGQVIAADRTFQFRSSG